MRGYKIRNNCNGYFFEFIPINNKKQPIGNSTLFSSVDECHHIVLLFRNFVKEHKISSDCSEYVTICQVQKGWLCQYCMDDKTIFQSRAYESKQNCKKSIHSLYQNIDEYTTFLWENDQ